ncbi:DCXR-like protein [Mya arenaria]|uniref:DCXR-like protein n=1 Tax=Mya arenaria TaxID=6604 RepID=A0ABY7DK37_MYAAR|nr:DCXR-like protein [Mya arenaria]
MEINFKGKNAVVTGAGKGIGRDVAKRLAALGAHVVAISRTQADLDSLKTEVPSIETVAVDLADWAAARTAVAAIPNVDMLVNNAGTNRLDKFLDVKEEDLDLVMDINFKAVFNVAQVVSRQMVDRKSGGAIVNVSSAASYRGLLDHAVYCASKAAVDKLTNVMALELGQYKIRVNSVNPTVALTELGKIAWSDPVKADPMLARIPMGRFLDVVLIGNFFAVRRFSEGYNGRKFRLPGAGGVVR